MAKHRAGGNTVAWMILGVVVALILVGILAGSLR